MFSFFAKNIHVYFTGVGNQNLRHGTVFQLWVMALPLYEIVPEFTLKIVMLFSIFSQISSLFLNHLLYPQKNKCLVSNLKY